MTSLSWPLSKKRPRSVRSSSRLRPLISLLAFSSRISPVGAQFTCTFSGTTFQAGDILGDAFQTRCGSADDYPCFCAPGRDPPIDCPYCGIATDMNSQGIVCARVGGPFIKVINLDGIAEECSCNRDINGNPQSTCLPPGTSDNNPAPAPSQSEVCTLVWADGSIDVFQDGESYGELFETACGSASEFPCFCNVSIQSKLYCPYCTVPTPTGDLVCGGIGDTFVTINENSQAVACYCNGNLDTECSLTSPVGTPTPTPMIATPVSSPSLMQSDVPSVAPTVSTIPPFLLPQPTWDPDATFEPTTFPTISPATTRHPTVSSPPMDKPSVWMPSRTPPVVLPVPGCSLTDAQGNETFVHAGEILTTMDGPCSPVSSYPVICNPTLPGQVEYPYCVFTMDGTWDSSKSQSAVCAQNGEQVAVPTDSASELATCSCLYLNPYIGAVSSCPELLATVRLVWSGLPTTSPSESPMNDEPSSPQTTPGTNDDQGDSSNGTCQRLLGFRSICVVGWLMGMAIWYVG